MKTSAKMGEARRLGATIAGDFGIYAVLALAAVSMLLPFVHELAKSLSHPDAANRGLVALVPQDVTAANYAYFLRQEFTPLWRSYLNSVFLLAVGTSWNVVFTMLYAYPLSRPKGTFKAAGFCNWLIVFSIIFLPPMIPYFLAVRSYGIMDTLWVIVIAHTVSPFNAIIVRTFLKSLPEELFESARMDGAGDVRQAFQIAFPLSLPVIATIIVYTSVLMWNMYMHALLFIRDATKMPLQVVVRNILSRSVDMVMNESPEYDAFRNSASTKSALLILSILPMLIMYPFLQKYFAKGALVGSVKS